MDTEALAITQKVHALFKEKGLTLSVAESCTGGLISHYITALPGASIFFQSGVIAYSLKSKEDILKISPVTISKYGLVSEETAREMAEKIRTLTRTDFSLSTTGNLGPDVLEGKERGLIYIGLSKEGKTLSKEIRLSQEREENKKTAAILALKFLVEIVER